MSDLPAVVGIAEHRGWAILVCVAAPDGVPEVVDRRRVDLIGPELPSQPYHHEAAELDPTAAEELVGRVKHSVGLHARTALSQLRDDLGARYRLVSIALQEGPRGQLPETVAEVLQNSNTAIQADSALYRDALCGAAEELGIAVALHPRGAEADRAALALGADTESVAEFLVGVGRSLGPPWRKEHRSAVAAAIAVLGGYAKLSGLAT